MAHRSRSKGHDKVIDVLRWGGSNHFFGAMAAGSVAQTYITDGATETIMRIRGELLCYMDGASAPAKLTEIAIGAMVVQAGSSTTVIQKPLTDPDAPWFFYERFSIGYEEGVIDVVDYGGVTWFRKSIDVKVMRIFRPGREVQLVAENITLGTASSVNMSFSSRVLLGSH